jgi:transposase-like protein
MATYRKAYAAKLTNLLVQGVSVADAAKECDLSEDTVRRWRQRHWEEIRALQGETTQGVLGSLKSLLSKAVKTLATLLDAPNAAPPDLIRAVRTIFASYEVMQDLDFEARRKELEKRLQDLLASASPSPGGGRRPLAAQPTSGHAKAAGGRPANTDKAAAGAGGPAAMPFRVATAAAPRPAEVVERDAAAGAEAATHPGTSGNPLEAAAQEAPAGSQKASEPSREEAASPDTASGLPTAAPDATANPTPARESRRIEEPAKRIRRGSFFSDMEPEPDAGSDAADADADTCDAPREGEVHAATEPPATRPAAPTAEVAAEPGRQRPLAMPAPGWFPSG